MTLLCDPQNSTRYLPYGITCLNETNFTLVSQREQSDRWERLKGSAFELHQWSAIWNSPLRENQKRKDIFTILFEWFHSFFNISLHLCSSFRGRTVDYNGLQKSCNFSNSWKFLNFFLRDERYNWLLTKSKIKDIKESRVIGNYYRRFYFLLNVELFPCFDDEPKGQSTKILSP